MIKTRNKLSGYGRAVFAALVCMAFMSCEKPDGSSREAGFPSLPMAHSNNAVAKAIDANGRVTFYSFNGLTAAKTWDSTSRSAFACSVADGECRAISDVPVEQGRLASVAAVIGNRIYIFGGYTVAEDGSEVSTPEVFQFDPIAETYDRVADMPVPVDDMVAFTYQERYIYLVSGWHNDGNVSLVQVYDAQADDWFQATDYPGAPVFGHAGGAVGGDVVIADGVAVIGEKEGRRVFGAVNEVWHGKISEDDPATIKWKKLPPHSGKPLYRMAARGDETTNRIVFLGGGDNPYNYNGIGYDGVATKPSDRLFAFDLEQAKWIDLGKTNRATMDHRGLLINDSQYCTLGGMDSEQVIAVIQCTFAK